MRMLSLALAPVLTLCALSSSASAQGTDSLHVGDRVRVRVVSAPRTSNVITGNVAAISQDSLTVTLPGSRGTAVFPRLGIAQLGVSDGLESRMQQLAHATPLLLLAPVTVSLATRPTPSSSLRSFNIGLVAIQAYVVTRLLSRPRLERWRTVTDWLDGR
jgi:hypothetical protein